MSKYRTLKSLFTISIVYRAKWVKLNGHIFKPGAAIIHDIGSEDTDMKVAVITNIYIINGNVTVFKAKLFQICDYNHHFRAHILTPLHTSAFFSYDQLPLYLPLHARTCRVLPNDSIVIMPFYLI